MNAAVAFVEYDRLPEARYLVAIGQAYAAAQWFTRHGATEGLDPSRLAVANPLRSMATDAVAAAIIAAVNHSQHG